MRALALLVVLAACDRGPKDRPEPAHEPEGARRVIEPPVGVVRPLPPFLISAAGVGPYRLGDRLADLLQQLPSGPRIAMFEIPGVLHRSLIRAEEGDSVRIGGEPSGSAAFVAVLDPQVARTEGGIHVGSTRAELEKTGPLVEELVRAHDPRLALPSVPRGARVLFDSARTKDRIAAIVVTNEVVPAVAPSATEPACPRPADTESTFGACFSPGIGEQVEVNGSDISIRGAGSDKLLAPTLRIAQSVVFARPVRIEGRDELVIVTRSDEAQLRTWSLLAYRVEAGKLIKSADGPLYSLSATNARWIGVDLAEIDLFLEVTAGTDSFEVGGLLTTRADLPDAQAPWRDVVMISPVSVAHRHGKPSVPATPTPEGSGSAVPMDSGSDAEPSNP